ncbi:MAG TPA: glycosyltransferase [Verrucomicrobiae bacterium]|nr:glycosyltransferase [Verrucomicrobiae bacterium]
MTTKTTKKPLRIGIVVPHIFMHKAILPYVIFSPGQLALELADELQRGGSAVTLFSPGPVNTAAANITTDLQYFERELSVRGDTYLDLLKKHPLTFVTLARQVQSELIATAYTMANADDLDIIHIYTNEEDIALPFAQLCHKPVVFTHHDPFNFSVKYKNVFPKYKNLNWISLSYAQRAGMPGDTNWVSNIYHGLSDERLAPVANPRGDYIAYLGRIVQPKGLHLAIAAIQQYNARAVQPLTLKIAGKHYAGHKKDTYWQTHILPALTDTYIEYVDFVNSEGKPEFLGNARALIIPSLFDEPFGMVSIEALACGTPVIGLDSGAIPEVIQDGKTGYVVSKVSMSNGGIDEFATARALTAAIQNIPTISRKDCRRDYEARFTAERMCLDHLATYETLIERMRP